MSYQFLPFEEYSPLTALLLQKAPRRIFHRHLSSASSGIYSTIVFVIIIPNLIPLVAIFNVPGTILTALKTLSYLVFTIYFAGDPWVASPLSIQFQLRS